MTDHRHGDPSSTATPHGTAPDTADLDDPGAYAAIFERARLRLAGTETWRVDMGEVWTTCTPPGSALRHQGWKLHVSATLESVEAMLEAVCPILIEHRTLFKFAKSPAQVLQLLDIRCERGVAGKILTVYPSDDEQFRRLAALLDEATAGLAGPAILSDRPLRPGSLVHYRYGGFTGELTHLDTDGSYGPALIAPDGSWWPDERKPWFAPPPWAPLPLPEEASQDDAKEAPGKPVLLDDRFVVRGAIRHSNRGGVYRAVDQRTDKPVIIKQARPHVGGDVDGWDAGDWLRHEAAMLDRLAPLGVTPAKVSLFTYQEHTFLAEEDVAGTTLREWARAQTRANPGGWPATADVVAIARQVAGIVRRVHHEGLVLRDLNPSNLLLTPQGRVVLIDPEYATEPGTMVVRKVTRGYAPVEQTQAPRYAPACGATADLYALGATIFHLCTGLELVLARDDDSADRRHDARVHAIVRTVSSANASVRRLLPLLLALLDDDPSARPTIEDVDTFLGRCGHAADAVDNQSTPLALADADQRRLLDDSIATLVAHMTPDGPHLWPPNRVEGRMLDGLALQGGAAGPLDVLRRASLLRDDGGLLAPLQRATRWMADNLGRERRVLPGLYFGRAGTAWALYDAAAALGDEEAAARAISYAKLLPTRWFNPDVTHGLSGSGLAQLHLWRYTGDEELAQRAISCAEHVAAARTHHDGRVEWPIPTSPPSALAGLRHYGFAHGTAGVATFLLAAGTAFGRQDLVELATEAADTLVAAAQRTGEAVDWPSGPSGPGGKPGTAGLQRWWCSGAAGVGLFLLRMWQATGEPRYLEMVHGACVAVHSEQWFLAPPHCHGLASGGELLLDTAAATGEPQYLAWAREHAAMLHLRHAVRDGRRVVFGESPDYLQFSYSLGLAGVAAFLLRLTHGGPRPFMVDEAAFVLPAQSPADLGAGVGQLAGMRP